MGLCLLTLTFVFSLSCVTVHMPPLHLLFMFTLLLCIVSINKIFIQIIIRCQRFNYNAAVFFRAQRLLELLLFLYTKSEKLVACRNSNKIITRYVVSTVQSYTSWHGRATEGGPRANTKSGTPHNGLCEGGLGARPQEIDFTCSEVCSGDS